VVVRSVLKEGLTLWNTEEREREIVGNFFFFFFSFFSRAQWVILVEHKVLNLFSIYNQRFCEFFMGSELALVVYVFIDEFIVVKSLSVLQMASDFLSSRFVYAWGNPQHNLCVILC
jgi:hypothetical protein